MRSRITPTGMERRFGEDEIIVSKTDTNGRITYANDVFLRVSDYTESEVLGQPHSLIRHPEMPRSVFQLLWTTIQSGSEIFAYVVNLAKNGDHYWVLAHVTPTFDSSGRIIGYHSNRRCPDGAALSKIQPLYRQLLDEERAAHSKAEALSRAGATLARLLASRNVQYDEFVFSL